MKGDIQIAPIDQTVFYALDQAIKSYRQFALRNIRNAGFNITVDQWLLLKTISDNPALSQKALADIVFKDHASVTRMIESLVRKGYLVRDFHPEDRRRFTLRLTAYGKETIHKLIHIVQKNRRTATSNLSHAELDQLNKLLKQITKNCSIHEKQS